MRRLRHALTCCIAAASAACSGESGPNISGVDPISIASIELQPRLDTIFAADTIQPADTLRLTASVVARTGAPMNLALVWSSSDSSVATVEEGLVRAVGFGTTEIRASAGKAATALVVVARAARGAVVTPVAEGVSATTAPAIYVDDPISAGYTLQLFAEAHDEAGKLIRGVSWEWSSSAPDVAVVNSAGLVTAIGLGSAVIRASTAGMDGEMLIGEYAVNVTPLVQSVTIDPLPGRVVVGDTLQLRAVARGPQGEVLANRRYAWSTTHPVAAVDSTGRLMALAPGQFTVTARTGFVTSTATSSVEVLPRVFTRIDAGGDFTCATISLNRVYCFGVDSSSQLAAAQRDTVCIDEFGGRDALPCSLLPLRVRNDLAAPTLSAGGAHACALDAEGRAYCWGRGGEGALGNGSVGNKEAPALVTSTSRFVSISAGEQHTCALVSGGAAWCWGEDLFGQLGNVKKAASTTPIPVEGGHAFTEVVAGYAHTCGVRTDRTAFCWGANAEGQLGRGNVQQSDVPVAVAGGLSFVQVAPGRAFTCGLATTGAIYCWGEGRAYQLGRGADTTASTSPVPVAGGISFAAIAAGDQHACALANSGQIYCWGTFDLGVMGSEVFGQTPQPLPDGTGFTSVTAGRRHACGIRANGTAACWGSNVLGPFGDGLQALWRPRIKDDVVLPH